MVDTYLDIQFEDMMPLVRTKSLCVQDIGSEVLILDERKNHCYCLNNLASMVWRKCDGQNSLRDIAVHIEHEMKRADNDFGIQSLVNVEVERLKQLQLIEASYVRASSIPLLKNMID